ncbi:TRAP transporter substrate-binding protein [Petroclostridium sp. X23]|uniref:TRAP transporter substrate-binding protein n=1 Tax=Petroclostridium sp. X23 TaxID=3045146 RepID=UPI0024AC97CB|nr:TRAP transporter substrate-binding protein [Petroclostridium sp. X23]WHH59370.1 TRAP transporter substrate-binding protein [Petroclostridium sp. X23]
MKKKVVSLVLVSMMTASLFTGCLSSKQAPATKEEPKQEAKQEAKQEQKAEVKKDAKIIKISNGINEQHPAYLGSKEFERIVEEKTDGRYDIQVYANAQLGDDVKATQDVKMGTLEMVVTSASPLTGMAKEFMVFDLPFIVPNTKAADAIFDGPVGKKIGDTLDSKGIHLLAYYENGFRNLTNSAKEVKSPEDVKGLKIRTMENPIHLAAWKAMGANPTPMPFSEVFTAMQQHTIDGQENPVPTINLNKFYEVQKYMTMTGHVYGPHIMLISGKLWESLSDEDKKIFEEAAQESAKLNRAKNREMSESMVADLKAAGMTVTELTPEQQKAFQDAVQPVYTQFENEIGKELIAEFKAAIEAAK